MISKSASARSLPALREDCTPILQRDENRQNMKNHYLQYITFLMADFQNFLKSQVLYLLIIIEISKTTISKEIKLEA